MKNRSRPNKIIDLENNIVTFCSQFLQRMLQKAQSKILFFLAHTMCHGIQWIHDICRFEMINSICKKTYIYIHNLTKIMHQKMTSLLTVATVWFEKKIYNCCKFPVFLLLIIILCLLDFCHWTLTYSCGHFKRNQTRSS